ncbi:EAL and GGDEF domain-containing protein [Acinetobacter puyangensis]|uniref:sensor domain-containing protein n=1 Tax=Acinetobacter puyangensis TaxID=1096779 RepID=UPI003A4D9976
MLNMDAQNSPYLKMLESLQLDESLKNFRIQLIFLSFFLTIILSLYLFNRHYFNSYFTIWAIIATTLLIIGIIVNQLIILERSISNKTKTIFLYFSVILSGIFIALDIELTDIHLGNQINEGEILFIGNFILCHIIVQITALFFLTYHYKLFLAFIIPTLLPILKIHFIDITSENKFLYIICMYAYAVVILYLGYIISGSRINLMKSKILNEALEQESLRKQQHINYLSLELEEEKKRAELIKQELQRNNNLLEEKVQERTSDIETMNARLERSHQNLEMVHETAGIASWDWDIRNRLIDTSNFLKIFGYSIKNMDHYIHHLSSFIHCDDIDQVKYEMRQHLRGFTTRYEAVYRIYHQTEQWIWVHDMGRVVQRDPKTNKPIRMVGIRRNINNEKKAKERLKLSANVFKKAAQGIFILDEKLNYVDVNPYYLNLIHLTEKQLLGRHVFDITQSNKPELQQIHLSILSQLMSKGEFEGEIIEELSDSTELPLWIHIHAIYDAQNKISQYIGIVTDLTERKTSEKRLSYLQNYDALTDLPNRYYFNNQLHSYLTNSLKQLTQCAVIRINLDRFRYYNELLNYHGGDELLRQVANRLRQANAEAVVVARLNADDFSVILECGQNTNQITLHCEKLIAAFEEPFKINHQELIMTISIGVAIFPEHGRQMDSLNNHAELALLEAKRIGGNTIRIYHNEKRLSSASRVNLENELRRAIQQNELTVYYQPKFNAKTKTIDSFEALVRWNHPEHGIIPPAQFIPLAEETSLISNIGKIVLDISCAQIKKWSDLGFKNISVSVNIVAQQIQRGNFIEEIDCTLEKYGISSCQLELEITETSIMENSGDVKQFMHQLRQRKIKVSLDDFGTGYSSLAYLAQFPFDIIKIDRSFVSKIGAANQDAIVRAIIAMTKTMDKKVVAEGLETQAQYNFLIREGSDFLQGYLIGKPMPAEQATDFLTNYKNCPFLITDVT